MLARLLGLPLPELADRLGIPVPGLERLGLTHTFPSAEALFSADLTGLGLLLARCQVGTALLAVVRALGIDEAAL